MLKANAQKRAEIRSAGTAFSPWADNGAKRKKVPREMKPLCLVVF